MTGERNSKIPLAIRLNSIPQMFRKIFGDEKALKLCRKSNYRERRHNVICPECGRKQLRFRSGTHDLRCVKCHTIVPVKKIPMGLNTSAANPLVEVRIFAESKEESAGWV